MSLIKLVPYLEGEARCFSLHLKSFNLPHNCSSHHSVIHVWWDPSEQNAHLISRRTWLSSLVLI